MPPSTKAERAEAIAVLRRHMALVGGADAILSKARLERGRHLSHMVHKLGMSRREIGEAIGVPHPTIRSWLEIGERDGAA